MPRRSTSIKTTPQTTKTLAGGEFLREVARRPGGGDRFPFSVPVIRALDRLSLSGSVTYFVGENGSGKSTLLEGTAAAAHLPAIGSADLSGDATLGAQRELADALRLVWNRR